jgi:hypothetical protein
MIHYEARCYCDDDNADVMLYHRLDELAEQLTGTDFNVVRGWLDCSVRPALFGEGDGDEQPDENVQEGLLPGPEVGAGQVLAVGAPADEHGVDEGAGAGSDPGSTPGEVGPGVGTCLVCGGTGVDESAATRGTDRQRSTSGGRDEEPPCPACGGSGEAVGEKHA